MSYSPTEWENGDVITAEKLNKLEGGVAKGGYDAEIYLYHDNNSAHDFEVTVNYGSYAEISAMIADNIPPNILLRLWDELDNIKASANLTAIYGIQEEGITFACNVAVYNSLIERKLIYWKTDNTVEVV